MTRPRRSGSEALFPEPPAAPFRKGRHERQLDAAITTARAEGSLAPTDAGLITLLRALGRALDGAEKTEQPYAVAQVARELRATLDAARLTPANRAGTTDPFAALMESLDDDTATA